MMPDYRMNSRRPGSALLEAVIALALFGTVVASGIWLTAESVAAANSAAAREAEVSKAHRLMTAASLWPASELDRRLGDTQQAEFRLLVNRTTKQLYDIAVTDSTGTVVFLRTTVARFE